jgi:hypothetical protein
MIRNVAGVEADDVAGMRDKLEASIFVEKEYKKGANDNLLSTVNYIMQSKSDADLLKEKYNKIKQSYKDLFKDLEELKKQTSKDRKDANDDTAEEGSRANAVIMAYISAHRYEKNLQHTVFTMALKAHRARRNQARSMAVKWYHAGKKQDDKKTEKKTSVHHNSTVFNIDII